MWRWVASYAAFEAVVVAAALLATLWHAHMRRHPRAVELPPGFSCTDERFIDPTTGVVHEVWFNPETGERRYKARPAGASGPPNGH